MRVGFAPTPRTVTRDPGTTLAATSRNAAADASPGISISNAGIFPSVRVEDLSPEILETVMATNFKGTVYAVQACLPALERSEHGRVIVTSSITGPYTGYPGWAHYGASKAALNSFGQSMARALAPLGIAVASVAPGYVATDMASDDLNSPRGAELRAQSPFNRVATTAEIAAAVVYLASEQAEWASGAVLDLNGASYLR